MGSPAGLLRQAGGDGRRQGSVPCPRRPLLLTMSLGTIQRRLGMPSELTMGTVEMLKRTGTYSIEKARTRLGFEPLVSLDHGMTRVQQWARGEGLIR